MNPPGFPPNEASNSNTSSSSWQEGSSRFRSGNHYQGPYPTSNPRGRSHGDFSQRGRYPYNRRGGGTYRPHSRDNNFDQQQQQGQSFDNRDHQSTGNESSYRSSNNYFRLNMLEDPWFHMKPTKVPNDGTTLVFDSSN